MNKGRWIAAILAGAVVAMAFGSQGPLGGFWGAEPAADVGITGALAGGFLAYGLIEGAGFGAGLAWLAFGRPLLGRGGDATAAYLSIGWLLTSWWPHGSLHQSIGHDSYGALLGIEYAFHATMIGAAVLVGWHLVRVTQRVGVVAAATTVEARR